MQQIAMRRMQLNQINAERIRPPGRLHEKFLDLRKPRMVQHARRWAARKGDIAGADRVEAALLRPDILAAHPGLRGGALPPRMRQLHREFRLAVLAAKRHHPCDGVLLRIIP